MDPFELAADLDTFAAEHDLFAPDASAEDVELPDDLDTCRDLANKLLRKYSRLHRDENDVRAVAESEYERIQRWLDDRTSGIVRERERVESLLDRLMRSYKEASGQKTLKLPNGELRLRPPKDRVVVDDEESFVSWAKQNADDLIETKWSVKKKAITDAAKEPAPVDGEEPELPRLKRELSAEPLPGLLRWKLYETSTGETLPGIVIETDDEPSFSLTSAREEMDRR